MKFLQYFDGHIVINFFGLLIRIKHSFKYKCPEVVECGITTPSPQPSPTRGEGEKIIVSLTSFPARINIVVKTIKTLLTQTLKPDIVVLWLAPEQFPNGEKDLPEELLELKKYGLTIDWYKDIRSYKKIIPTLKKYPNAVIITTDDDIYYAPDTIESLYKSYLEHKNEVQAHRCDWLKVVEEDAKTVPHPSPLLQGEGMTNVVQNALNNNLDCHEEQSSSRNDDGLEDDNSPRPNLLPQGARGQAHDAQFKKKVIKWEKTRELYLDTHRGQASFHNRLTGYGAVLYPPNCFYKDVCNEELIKELIPTHDDIWLWAMATLNGYKTRLVKGYSESINYVEDSQQYGLCKINKKGVGMSLDEAYEIMLNKYPQLMDILESEE